jgi:hypothetical protein
VLLLRGPQTVGELRLRTERMAQFDGIGAVESDLQYLAELPEALVLRLPRRPGQKEERWAQLLTSDATEAAAEAASEAPSPRPPTAGLAAEVASLRAEVAELRAELAILRAELGS